MTAPALVCLAQGSHDPRVASAMHSFRKQLQMKRPDLSVNVAFLDQCPPTGPQVVSALAHRGVSEVVFVPMSLTCALNVPGVDDMLSRVRAAHPSMAINAARPLGPATELLTILDERVRAALQLAHASQLDALVLAVPDCGDPRGASLLQRRARQWSSHHNLPVVVAFSDGSGITTAQAISSLRAQGRRHIAVGSLWLSADESYHEHTTQALERGATAVTMPIGVDERLLDMAVARYAYAAMALLDHELTSSVQIAL